MCIRDRTWVCYSPNLNKCYFEPCWLFADRGKLISFAWVDGINDWKGLSKKITSKHAVCMTLGKNVAHGRVIRITHTKIG